jgi:hypothetical protein
VLEIPVPARYFEVPVIVQVNLVDEVAQYRVTRFRVVEVGVGVFLEERFNAALILGHARAGLLCLDGIEKRLLSLFVLVETSGNGIRKGEALLYGTDEVVERLGC